MLDLAVHGSDGIPLESYVHLPKSAVAARFPVVLLSTPYPGSCPSNNSYRCIPTGEDPETTHRIDVDLLVRHGFAVVISNVRGTGNSGGCFEMGGKDEQADQAVLVQELAGQPWSNGRVGMIGHSYPSYTAWMAAIQAPPALKTVVVSGFMTDMYTLYHTPQGAASATGGEFQAGYASSLGFIPPAGGSLQHVADHLGVATDRFCPDVARTIAQVQVDATSDARDEAFYAERRLVAGIGNVTAAILGVSGFEDSSGLFHAFQDDETWRLLASPKRFVYGHWHHDLPPPADGLKGSPFPDWYEDVLLPWLDYWLKGSGATAPRLGVVDYNDGTQWRSSTAWPPAEAKPEVLYLADGVLSNRTGSAGTTLRLAPSFDFVGYTCTDVGQVFATPAATAPVTVAGNVFASLRLESDQPGGVLAVDLLDLAPEFRCSTENGYAGWTWLAGGGADLRFHEGNLRGKAFATAAPTRVRVDINNQAWTLQPGHRLALAVTADGFTLRQGQPYTPTVKIHADGGAEASQVVLPIVEGTFGGLAPTLEYPARPFAP